MPGWFFGPHKKLDMIKNQGPYYRNPEDKDEDGNVKPWLVHPTEEEVGEAGGGGGCSVGGRASGKRACDRSRTGSRSKQEGKQLRLTLPLPLCAHS